MSIVATTQGTNEPAKNEKKEPTRIHAMELLEFKSNVESMHKNTIELASIVSGLFNDAFRDYAGCRISVNTGNINELPNFIQNEIPLGRLYVSLYFKDRSNEPDRADCPIPNLKLRYSANSEGRSVFNVLNAISGKNAGRMFEITEDTYEALDPFRFFPQRKTNWNLLTVEKSSTYGFNFANNQENLVEITGLDLEKILSEIFGTRTEEGIFQYQAVPVQIVANVNGEYVVQISKLNVNTLNDMRKQMGGPLTKVEYHAV